MWQTACLEWSVTKSLFWINVTKTLSWIKFGKTLVLNKCDKRLLAGWCDIKLMDEIWQAACPGWNVKKSLVLNVTSSSGTKISLKSLHSQVKSAANHYSIWYVYWQNSLMILMYHECIQGSKNQFFFFLETNTQYLLSKTHKSPRVLKRLIKTWLLQLSAIWFITLLAAEASQSLKHWSSDLCKSPKEVSTSILHSLSQMPGHYSIQLKASSLCYVLLNDSYVKWPDPSIYALFFLYSYHSWKL